MLSSHDDTQRNKKKANQQEKCFINKNHWKNIQ